VPQALPTLIRIREDLRHCLTKVSQAVPSFLIDGFLRHSLTVVPQEMTADLSQQGLEVLPDDKVPGSLVVSDRRS